MELWVEDPLGVKSSMGLCRRLEDKVENSAEDGNLACEILEGRLKTLIRTVAI